MTSGGTISSFPTSARQGILTDDAYTQVGLAGRLHLPGCTCGVLSPLKITEHYVSTVSLFGVLQEATSCDFKGIAKDARGESLGRQPTKLLAPYL